MGRVTGLRFSRQEFKEALSDAIHQRLDAEWNSKDVSDLLSDLEDGLDGFSDIFEDDEDEDEDD